MSVQAVSKRLALLGSGFGTVCFRGLNCLLLSVSGRLRCLVLSVSGRLRCLVLSVSGRQRRLVLSVSGGNGQLAVSRWTTGQVGNCKKTLVSKTALSLLVAPSAFRQAWARTSAVVFIGEL